MTYIWFHVLVLFCGGCNNDNSEISTYPTYEVSNDVNLPEGRKPRKKLLSL